MTFDLVPHTILLTVCGSRAYGLHGPSSDVDLKGVAIPPARWFHGMPDRFEQAEGAALAPFAARLTPDEQEAARTTRVEGTVYELRKFLTLASECNPNVLDVLFCREHEVRVATAVGRRLREARGLFLTAQARHTFSGYAAAQLKRIQLHRRWLLEPPQGAPSRAAFGLPEHTLLPTDQLAAAEAAVRKQVERWDVDLGALPPADVVSLRAHIAEYLASVAVTLGLGSADDLRWLAAARRIGLDSNLVLVMQREREYESAARQWRQYLEWREHRNPARAALEATYGYDTKHASHLIRLLRMGREILIEGAVHVWRGADGGPGDADELKAIRQGAWSYDRLLETAQREDADLRRLYDEGRAVVPPRPDRQRIDALCVELVESSFA